MILCIADVLSPEELHTIHSKLAQGDFEEGSKTAGWLAKPVKYNQQLSPASPLWGELQAQLLPKLEHHPLIQIAAYPNIIHPLRLSRYQPGMFYGIHSDNALMPSPKGGMMRTDLSLTLFLSDPSSYEGGELVIDTPWGEQAYKLPAGSLVLYPAGFLHQVTPVVSGTRLVAVTWIQSWIRDPQQRQILFELQTLRQELFEAEGKTARVDRLSVIRANLMRQWVEF